MTFRGLKIALMTAGVAAIGVGALGASYLARNKIQIVIRTANWAYETPELISAPIDIQN